MPEPHVLQTICPEGKGLIRTYGWSDLGDVSGSMEGVTGFLRVTKTLAEEAARTMSGKGRGLCQQPRATRLRLQWRGSRGSRMKQLKNTSDVRCVKLARRVSLLPGLRGGTVTDKDTWNRLSQWRLHGGPAGMVGRPTLSVVAGQWMEGTRSCDATASKTWVGRASHTPDGRFLPWHRAGRPKNRDTVEIPVPTCQANVGSQPEH